ncbi:MAG: SRPBCC family protein [Actinobacteria bacterium]|nr:SRPBCC family protein [Actinomycetota bacterium]
MVKYADNPTARAEIHVAAPPSTVWPLVCDITVPSRFSTELTMAEWAEGTTGPCAGARFTGHSQHPAAGTWQTTCTVVVCEEPRAFSWVVEDPDDPAARWGFELEPDGAGTLLRQWAVLGPGRSGLTPAIEARPDKEERIVARRLAEHEANMNRCLAGIKELAERAPAGA